MDAKAFFANIAPTIFFAFVGTFLSTFVVGGWVYYFGQLGWGYPMALLPCLVFGSLISATDPVTVLAVFQALGVKVDLFSMVFGESVLNDAVAIVLSETLLTFQTPMPGVSFSSRVVAAVVQFCSIFGWSLVIGALYGAASAYVLKVADLRHHADSKFIGVALVVKEGEEEEEGCCCCGGGGGGGTEERAADAGADLHSDYCGRCRRALAVGRGFCRQER